MPLVEWTDDLSVGMEVFDTQHKGLLDIINRLHEAMKGGKARDSMSALLQELLGYTESHFGDEEALLKKHDYPGLAEQETQHQAFVGKLRELLELERKGSLLTSVSTLDFLTTWLIKHIKGLDGKYTAFLKAKGA